MEKLLNTIKKFIPKKLFKALQPVYHFVFAWLAVFLYKNPSEKLIIIGVTGTTGKTTSTYLMAKTLQGLGYKVGFTSTAMFGDGEKEWMNDKKMTMVGRFLTQKMLKKMVENKCQFAIVETTSEGIRQFRHRFINYDYLVFTGLYPEHIESHGSFENYKKAKGELFNHLKRCKAKFVDEKLNVAKQESGLKKIDLNRVKKTIIANLDDDNVEYFLDFWAEEKVGYTQDMNSLDNKKLPEEIKALEYGNIKTNEKGINFETLGDKIYLQILGKFNASNAMNAICVAYLHEDNVEKIKRSIIKIEDVAGRLEKINEGQNFTVIVDYAFEPNALEKLYETVQDISHNKVIHVLGATGGGRDKDRRPKLGKIAGDNADYVIVTNEDPYDEDPELIISQVAGGSKQDKKIIEDDLFTISDRGEAIKKAIKLAKKGDIVLITGKGNEQAICVANGAKIPWDDRKVVRAELNKFKNN